VEVAEVEAEAHHHHHHQYHHVIVVQHLVYDNHVVQGRDDSDCDGW
jgi:hypothetical protein